MIRCSGSFSSMRPRRSRAGPCTSAGMSNTPALTLRRSTLMLSSSKGNRPVMSANKMMPHDQMSEEDPW